MKCHYEVLGITKDADDAEIKSAYRKLALKWHPDKNLDNTDNAKEQFQLVQQAYEILSDKQERAWYDSHREQILRGANSEFQDKSLDVFQYFTTTCFKGYNDEEKGFYTVYRNIFDQIAKEDIEFIDNKGEFCEIPSFGNGQSDYETVSQFYNYWLSYSTKKSYSWLDPYDIREGKGDRRVLKIIEKENKKVRQKARKERNEEVRNLVAFVRKRDKRMQEFTKQMEAKTLENRKKQEILSKQKRLERKKMHECEKQAEWAKFDNFKSELEEIEKHLAQEFGEEISNSEDEEVDYNSSYCVACNKVFKNPKAFVNHELSKKHKENIEKLKETMREEEESFASDNLEDYGDLEVQNDEIIEESEEELSRSESLASENVNKDDMNHDLEVDEDSEELTSTKKKDKKKNKKLKPVLVVDSDENQADPDEISITQNSDDEFEFGKSKKQQKKKKKTSNKPKQENNEEKEAENKNNEENSIPGTSNKSKKEKKAKKDMSLTDVNDLDVSHCCVTCKANFPSKNKLFDHLKKTKHGVYIPKVKQNNKKHVKEK